MDVGFVTCRLDGANFRMSRWERVELEGCDLTDADFTGGQLPAARLVGCDLTGVQLDKAVLPGPRSRAPRSTGSAARTPFGARPSPATSSSPPPWPCSAPSGSASPTGDGRPTAREPVDSLPSEGLRPAGSPPDPDPAHRRPWRPVPPLLRCVTGAHRAGSVAPGGRG
ncbi:MAG: pentapeptide repeat-containing protein [Acidimicrobiia bacterium]